MGSWVCMNKMGLSVCVYCFCPGNQTATAARASWEGPSGAKREIQGNVPLLKILQQLLQVLPCAHMQAPLLPAHHTHPPCLRHSCTTRWQSFQLQSMQDPQPVSYQPTITGPFVLPTPTLPNKHPALCCPTTGVSKVYTPVVLQWYHNRHCSQKGRPESAQGLKRLAKARTSQIFLKLSLFL